MISQLEAPIGRRNYQSLTPLGIARFYSQKEIINLINAHYEIDEAYAGDEPEKFKYKRKNFESIPSQREERYVLL